MSTKKERMYQAIEKHGANLNALFKTKLDNVTLSKKLFSLEYKLHRYATQYCNGDIELADYDIAEADIAKKVGKLLGVCTADGVAVYPLVFNRDPRGYSLKLDSDWVRDNKAEIYRDLGGDGILAPDFNEVA